ncbi:MAG: hypothetical protein N2C14_18915, partial [Planctomycetales bacterium]
MAYNLRQSRISRLLVHGALFCAAALCLPPASVGQYPPPGASPPGFARPGPSPTNLGGPPSAGQSPRASLESQKVVDVLFAGNDSIPVDDILPDVRLRPGRQFDFATVESDVRNLVGTGKFVDVKPLYQQSPEGVIVIFRVVERPVILEIEFVGNSKVPAWLITSTIREKNLQDEVGVKVGDAVDPIAVSEGARR